jgi:disulfide bond formation protein DsbB
MAAWLLAASALGALGFAFIMQFGFHLEPCVLCLWQRVPFALAGLLALAAALIKPYGRITRIVLALIALVFLIGTGLALFHTGVERHWWLGTSGCSVQPLHGASIESMREQLLHTVSARCDEIAWTFLGLSMANWNLPFSAMLTVFAFLAWRHRACRQA